MSATTKTYRDGAGATFTAREWDDGSAHSAVTIIGDGAGGMLPKAEDAAHATGDLGIMALGVRKDTAVSLGADGDYQPPIFDADGKLWVNATVSSGATAGDVAHDTADSGNPVKLGAKATISVAGLTLVADADRTNLFAGIDGVQIVRPHCNLEDIVSAVATCTAGANQSIIASQGAGVKFYLTSVILRNGGASDGNCLITDGSGGTTKLDIPFPANTGAIYNPPVPIPFSAATAVYANPSGSDDVIVTIVGFKSKV